MIFAPLDIPAIPNKEKIIQQFSGKEYYAYTNEQGVIEIQSANKDDAFCHWEELTLLDHDGKWQPNAIKLFPELLKWIDDNFPFEHKLHVKLSRAKGNVLPHTDAHDFDNDKFQGYFIVDGQKVKTPQKLNITKSQDMLQHQLDNEPCGYRFIVNGSKNSLYMVKEDTQEKHFCTIPDDTDAWVLNNCTQPHGVDLQPLIDDQRIIGQITGIVNVTKHQQLLDKSKQRYKQFVVDKL